MTDTVKFPAALRPAWTSGATAGGIAGATFLSGAAWQGWDGALVVAELSGRRLNILQLDAAGTSATSSPLLAEQNVRLRAVMLGPDGSLYVTTDAKPGGDEIWRLTPRAIAGRP